MRVSRRNAEGYLDPTAYAAMVRVEQEARKKNALPTKKQCAAKRRRAGGAFLPRGRSPGSMVWAFGRRK